MRPLDTCAVRLASEELGDGALANLCKLIAKNTFDALILYALDGTGGVLGVGSVRSKGEAPSVRDRQRLLEFARHMGAGRRLRKLITQARKSDHAEPKAIFDSRGKLVDATGLARQSNYQDQLRRAVLQRLPPDEMPASERPDPWELLIGGRWTLVDRFENDGKHFVVAFKNPPGVVDPRRLSEDECRLLEEVRKGRTDQEIGNSMEMSRSTVATRVSGLVRKLGLEGRAEIPAFFRDLAGAVSPIHVESLVTISRRAPELESLSLTGAEQAVAVLVCRGISNRQIATLRGTSERTVANQLSEIYRKLGVSNRTELARRVHRDPPRGN
jgi:DNA-binding NarL/FixJ family response regulator